MKTNYSIAELLNNSTQTAQNVRKDINDFVKTGIKMEHVSQLEALVSNYYAISPDELFVDLLKTNRLKTKLKRAEIMEAIKLTLMQLKTGNSVELLASHDIKLTSFTNASNTEFEDLVKKFILRMEENMSYSELLKAEVYSIVQIRNQNLEFGSLMFSGGSIKTERKNATSKKKSILSNITTLNSLLNNIGKSIYANKERGQYDQYVMTSRALQAANSKTPSTGIIVEPLTEAA